MIKINKKHDMYSPIADIIAAVFGFGASCLMGSFCNSIISVQDVSGAKKGLLKLGKTGLETVTMYTVSQAMRNEIDDAADAYNEIVEIVDIHKQQKALESSESSKELYHKYEEA